MIGFNKSFSWRNIERVWIKIDGISHEMTLTDCFN